MNTLEYLFDLLASGEFSNIAIGQSVTNSITAENYPKIVNNINLGLIELYKRFKLRKKSINLHQVTGVPEYYLRSEYVTSSNYINTGGYLTEPTDEDFTDDIIQVIEAYREDGSVLPINDKNYPTGLFTTAYDIVKVQPFTPLETLSLVYLASYPKIEIDDDFNPASVILTFPTWLYEPLLAYVAARVFQGKSSKAAEGERSLYTTFMYQYENACKRIELQGLASVDEEVTTVFNERGFV